MWTNHVSRSRRSTSIGVVLAAVTLLGAAEASAQITPDWVTQHDGVDGFFFGFQVPVYLVTDSQGAVYINNSTLRAQKTDIQTIKYAPDGTEIWSVTYDGPSQNVDAGKGITMDSNGDILVLGQSESVFLVIKYDASDGSIIETMQHEPGGIDRPNALATDDTGNIYVTGSSWPPGTENQNDFYTVKMDTTGNVLWTARYNGPGPFLFAQDIAVDIALDSNGDVYVTGPSNDVHASPHFVTIKYRGTDGAQLWLSRHDLAGLESVALLISPEGDVYVTGAAADDRTPFVTVKYDGNTGSVMWVSNNPMGSFGHAFGMALDSQGDVYVTGRLDPDFDRSTFNENVMTMRLRSDDGVRQWLSLYGEDQINLYDEGLAIAIDTQDNLWVTGSTRSFGAAGLLLLQYDITTGQIVDQGTFEVPNVGVRGQAMGLDSAQNIIVAGTTRADPSGFFDFLTLKYPGQTVGASVIGAESLLMHDATELAIDLNVSNSVEPRLGGPVTLAFEMDQEMDGATVNAGNVQLTCAVGPAPSVLAATLDGTNTVVVDIDAMTELDCCNFAFAGMLSTGGTAVADTYNVRRIDGDMDFSGAITGGDASIIKPHFGEIVGVDISHPKWDFDRNGGVTGGDFSLIKPKFGDIGATCP